jgi:hypothetical protein
MSECKACNSARARRYNAAHREERRAYDASRREYKRDWPVRRRYGITLANQRELLERQGGRCAICRTPIDAPGCSTGGFHVDHDHSTGAVRGLLCNNCNLGVGYFADDPDRLRAAAEYIEINKEG